MPAIEELFQPHSARSASFDQHAPGPVAFITNGFRNNGVVGFVTSAPTDRQFDFTGIALSAFAEATVQTPPFIARGNGGSGLIVLEPRTPMTPDQLGSVAAYINTRVRWRFSWYRQASVERIRRIEIPNPTSLAGRFAPAEILPAPSRTGSVRWEVEFQPFTLDSIYELSPGNYHNTSDLPVGPTPLISCGAAENGITAFVSVPQDRIYRHRMTIAFNGMNTLTANYHPYRFAAKDDVAVCKPRAPLRVTTQLFVQVMLNRERWRYSYYRKCFMDKLRRFEVELPAKGRAIDEDTMQAVVEATPYWGFLKERLIITGGQTLRR